MWVPKKIVIPNVGTMKRQQKKIDSKQWMLGTHKL